MSGAGGTTLYAFGLGLVGALNPCGFPLLPAYLSFFVGDPDAPPARRVARAIGAGGLVSVGFVGVFGLLGILVESGIEVLLGWVGYVMIPLGLGMAILGGLVLAGRQPRVPLPHLRAVGRGRGPAVMVGFGLSYAVASLSCALPLFLAGVAGAFTRSGYGPGVEDFLAYGLGMGLFLVALAVVTATLGPGALRHLRLPSRFLPRVGGALLVVIGAYLVYYWVYALADPLATPAVVRAVENVQSTVSGWLSSYVRWVGVALGALVLSAVAAIVVADRHGALASTDDARSSRGKENAPDDEVAARPEQQELAART